MEQQATIITATKKWVKNLVIDLNLCPFAAHPYKLNRIAYIIVQGENMEQWLTTLAHNMINLIERKDIETTLLIFSEGLKDFETYLDFLTLAEQLLSDLRLEDTLQLASFHPNYQFEGTQPNDVENYTNRSPYPMLHLIKADSIAKVIETYPDIEDIPKNNITKMQELGLEYILKLLK